MPALIHDFGKIFTQTFDDNGIAHYYGHAEYSSYLALVCGFSLKVAQLVGYHMYPFFEASATAWKKRLGEDFWQEIEILHKCDIRAH